MALLIARDHQGSRYYPYAQAEARAVFALDFTLIAADQLSDLTEVLKPSCASCGFALFLNLDRPFVFPLFIHTLLY